MIVRDCFFWFLGQKYKRRTMVDGCKIEHFLILFLEIMRDFIFIVLIETSDWYKCSSQMEVFLEEELLGNRFTFCIEDRLS